MTKPKTKFANHELVTLSLFLLGGDAGPVDLEHIAVKANALAPGRFAWRNYPSQINIKNVDAFLWDAKKPKNGGYVLNSGKDEWLLTVAGVTFARRRITDLQGGRRFTLCAQCKGEELETKRKSSNACDSCIRENLKRASRHGD